MGGYRVEYAKSDRSGCRKCKLNIGKDTVRVAKMVPSPHFDGDMPLWHHAKCVLAPHLLTDISLLVGFDGLRWDDQQKIKKLLGFEEDAPAAKSAGGKKAAAMEEDEEEEEDAYATVGYTGAGASCAECSEKIAARTLRLKVEETGEVFHIDCWERPAEVKSTAALIGFEKLKVADRKAVQALFPAGATASSSSAPAESDAARQAREYSEKLWKTKDDIKGKYNANELRAILKHNDQGFNNLGPSELVDRVAEGMLNGAIPRCTECKGHMAPHSGGKIKCHGNLSAWSRCTFEADGATITRAKWKNPSAANIVKLMEEIQDEKDKAKTAWADGPAAGDKPNPDAFKGLVFVVLGDWDTQDDDITKIEEGGGSVSNSFTAKVTHVLATYDEVNTTPAKKAPVKRTKALASSLPILDPCVLTYCAKQKKTLAHLENLSDFAVWVGGKAVKPDDAKTKPKGTNQKKRKRLVVPPIDKDCEYREQYEIYVANNSVYAVTLNMTDLSVGDRGKNSLYIMQLLQHKTKKTKYALFLKWGRIGSEPNFKVDDYNSPAPMIRIFEEKFYQMTKNHWESYMQNEFEKKPNGYVPVDLDSDDADDEEAEKTKEVSEAVKERRRKLAEVSKTAKLDPRVAELISLIFNKEMINKQMEDMKIDTKKMPLGQLSKKALREGMELLEKIEALIKDVGYSPAKLADLCNQFYTKVPHDFGNNRPPVIDDKEKLQAKFDLLDVLMDIEVAARMLEAESEVEDPLMKKYKELGNTISALDHDSEEFKRLATYVHNTEDSVKLKILDIYKVCRHGEEELFSAHHSLDYRKLLFHGSSVAVFPAILSGGIKIMPHSGGRVGRGNYSADMIYKSQGYCGKHGRLGLILLNEVALGKVNRIYQDNSRLVVAPSGHQSVLACGQIHPDPKKDYVDTTLSPSGHPVIIPQGTKINQPDAQRSSFIHNEYLVYDATQVHMRYLLRLEWPY